MRMPSRRYQVFSMFPPFRRSRFSPTLPWDLAERRARELGFSRSTADWKELVEDDHVDIVAIAAPNALHEPIALAAIEAGKTVYCEKPLSTTVESALRMTEAAEAAGVTTSVGFNFLRNPMIGFARRLIETGEIGDVTGFRGRHAENYMARPDVAHSFRTDPAGGGAAADIGSHIISLARFLLGPVEETVRRLPDNSSGAARFSRCRRIAPGRGR